MKNINVVNGPANASAIILGCMRIPALSVVQAEKLALLYGFDIASLRKTESISSSVRIAFRANDIKQQDLQDMVEMNQILLNLKLMKNLIEEHHNGN